MNTNFQSLCIRAIVFVVLALSAGVAQAQSTLFSDEFNTTTFNSTRWSTYDTSWFLQRTQFGNVPTMGTEAGVGFARLRLDSYNPDPAYRGSYLRGTEVASPSFNLGAGLEVEARLRGRNLPPGIVFAMFTLGQRGVWPTTYLKEEIDFEFLTNFAPDTLWLNVWDDWNPNRGGPNKATTTKSSGLDRNVWNIYKIRWLNNRIEWLVNNVVVRTSTDILPEDPMAVRFNIWAAAADWGTAYDSKLVAASTTATNKSYFMDIDYVRVRQVAPPTGAFQGTGNGLAATYYDNRDFTGKTVTRIDPRIKFDWGQYAPDVTLGNDSFSARWTGFVQPQFTQSYRFYATSDDGVRVWVNNQLVIDGWIDRGATESSSVSIALKSGQLYPIKVEYYENAGAASMKLAWSSSSTSKQLVPQTQLYSLNDSTSPTAAITTPYADYSYNGLASATGTASDSGGSTLTDVFVRLQRLSNSTYWNGSAWTAAVTELRATGTSSWTFAMPSLVDGRYTLSVRGRDGAGNLGILNSVSFYSDTIAPTITITRPASGGRYPSIVSATGTASDAVGVAGIQARLFRYADNRYWSGSVWQTAQVDVNASGTTSWTFPFPSLATGNYSVQIIARDWYGNIRYSAPVNFTVAPVAAISAQPVSLNDSFSAGYISGSSVVLAFSAPLDPRAATASNNYHAFIDDEPVTIIGLTVNTAHNTVTLALPHGAISESGRISITWQNLTGAKGAALLAGSWNGLVP